MRFNILGFDQLKATELGLSIDELMILRHLHDFASSGRMETTIHDNEMYYWVKYDKFVNDLPILNMKKTRVMEIFNNNLCEKPSDWESRLNGMSESTRKRTKSFKHTGVLKGYTKKDSTGTYSYFTFTKKFYDLIPAITENDEENKKADTGKVSTGQKSKINNSNTIIHKNNKNNTKKTKFHNLENESIHNYSKDELEKMLQESQKGKFDCDKNINSEVEVEEEVEQERKFVPSFNWN